MTIYISGPMTGLKDFNKKAFNLAERTLRQEFKNERYLRIINPVWIGKKVDDSFNELNEIISRSYPYKKLSPTHDDYMRLCLVYLCDCTHILFIEGWEESEGAGTERYVSKKIGIKIADSIEELKRIREEECRENS